MPLASISLSVVILLPVHQFQTNISEKMESTEPAQLSSERRRCKTNSESIKRKRSSLLDQSSKFVSVAERVRAFECLTPPRFHKRPHTDPPKTSRNVRYSKPTRPPVPKKPLRIELLDYSTREEEELQGIQRRPMTDTRVLKKVKAVEPCHFTEAKDRIKNAVVYFENQERGRFGQKNTTDIKPFSFEKKDKILQKRKEEKIRAVLEEERKAREFHATPLPPFIKRRGPNELSSLYVDYNNPQSFHSSRTQKNEPFIFKARPAKVLSQEPYKSIKPERFLTAIPHEMHTEKRAKERANFESRRFQNEAELENLKRERDAELKKQEEEEVARLRKAAEYRANPIRSYK